MAGKKSTRKEDEDFFKYFVDNIWDSGELQPLLKWKNIEEALEDQEKWPDDYNEGGKIKKKKKKSKSKTKKIMQGYKAGGSV